MIDDLTSRSIIISRTPVAAYERVSREDEKNGKN